VKPAREDAGAPFSEEIYEKIVVLVSDGLGRRDRYAVCVLL
jgi:hypothetical protein